MKKILLLGFLLISYMGVFAQTTYTVTPANYVSVYNAAANGDILLLDAGTYADSLDFPVGKTITLKALKTAATMPIVYFGWRSKTLPTTGSSLILDSLDIDLSYASGPNSPQRYYLQLANGSIVDKIIFKNCHIHNILRTLVKVNNAVGSVNEIELNGCTIHDIGLTDGYCLIWSRIPVNKVTVVNNTMYNYGGEGFFLAQNNAQTNTFVFDMHNNTIYKSGKDGSIDYGWCSILVPYASTCTYNISNNIFNRPFTTADIRATIVVPADAGTVTCANNLVVDYPNFTFPPASGWTLSNTYETTQNYFADTLNRNFTLAANIPYRGTDGNHLGAPRWWPLGTSIKNATELSQVKISVNNGMINLVSHDVISSVEMYDIKGSRMLAKNINATETSINAGNFVKGIYVLKIKSRNKIVTQKIALLK